MSYPQPKRPSSNELIEKYSVARYASYNPRCKPDHSDARAQVKRYK